MVNTITSKVKDSMLQVNIVQREKSDKVPLTSEDLDGMDARPSKRAKLDTSSKFAAENELRKTAPSIAVHEEKTRSGCKELIGMAKEKRYAPDSSTLDENMSKKKKFQQSTDKIARREKVDEDSIRLGDGPSGESRNGKITKLVTSCEGLSKEKPKYKLKNHAYDMGKSKDIHEDNLDKNGRKLVSHNLVGNIAGASVDSDEKIDGRIFEVTRKPDVVSCAASIIFTRQVCFINNPLFDV